MEYVIVILRIFLREVHRHWVVTTSMGKIQANQPKGIYSPAKQARPNPKGVEEIWPCDLPIGEVLSNENLTN